MFTDTTLSSTSVDLEAAQLAIESDMAERAIQRQAKENESSTLRGDWSASKAGRTYVSSFLNAKDTGEFVSYVSRLRDFIEVKKKGAGRHVAAAKLLRDTGIDIETMAFLSLKGIVNVMSLFYRTNHVKRSTMCIKVAELVHDEWRVKVFADTDYRKKLIARLMKDFDKRSYPREWRKRTIRNYFYSEQIEWSGWTMKERVQIGYALVYLFKEATGLIEFTESGQHVEPTAAFVEHLGKLIASQATQFTLYRPMVVRPRPWTQGNLFKGGYLSKQVRPYAIVKGARKRDRDRLQELDLSRVLPAVNAMQDTKWRVNREMLTALDWAYHEHGGGIGKLPTRNEEPLPVIPPDYETDEAVKRAHNLKVFNVRDRRRADKSRRVGAFFTLDIAKEYQGYDAIYFPHNLDSRGRAYPVPAFLNPQGADYVKALLEFADAEPAGDTESKRWIAIAGANAYGNDKVSLQERYQWVLDNEDMILSIASNYRTDLRWKEAGEPFQFLRFCLEWRDLKEFGVDHVSRMVIPVDATNSGLQHYSAMLRDEHGGFFVNLVPGHKRQDIYGEVAEKTKEKLVEQGDEQARHLLSLGIDRKTTKRQVMVVPYAGKYQSCLSYTRQWIMDKFTSGVKPEWDVSNAEVHNVYVNALSKPIWNAIDETVVKGKEAMLWLGLVASEFSKVKNDENCPTYERRMSWRTPDGFEVVHLREDSKEQRIATYIDGRVRLTYHENTGYLSPRDMALAVAPNFVHALDANHLRATIMLGLEEGITSFGMVHDSFGCHAGKMSQFLAKCVKPAFVSMYEADVLEDFAAQFRDICNVPPVPSKGKLDLQGVLQSEFFFS